MYEQAKIVSKCWTSILGFFFFLAFSKLVLDRVSSAANWVCLGVNNESLSQEDMYLERGIQKQENGQW